MSAGGLLEAKDDVERAALVEAGRLLFARPCRFFYASQRIDQLPPATATPASWKNWRLTGRDAITPTPNY